MANDQKSLAYDGVIDVESEEDHLFGDDKKIEDEILREFNADGEEKEWRVTLKKIDPRTKKQETCFVLSPDEIHTIFDRLKAEFGPGVYRAYVTCNNVLKRNLEYRIAKPIETPNVPQQVSQISDIAQLIRQQNEQMAAIMRGQNPNTQAVDPMAMFTGMMGAIASMKEVFVQPAQPAVDPMKSMDMFMRAFELAKDMQGDGGGSSSVYDIVREIIKSPLADKIGDQLSSFQSGQKQLPPPQRVQQRPPLANPRPMQIKIQDENQTENKIADAFAPNAQGIDAQAPMGLQQLPPQFVEQIRGQFLMWTDRAKSNSDPALYADLALDTYEPEMLELAILRPDLPEIAAYLAPESQNYWPWFQLLIEEIRGGLTQDIEVGDNGGNSVNQTQPQGDPVNALETNPNATGGASPAKGSENSRRSTGNKGDAQTNEGANARGKEKPKRKTTGAGGNAKPKTKRS